MGRTKKVDPRPKTIVALSNPRPLEDRCYNFEVETTARNVSEWLTENKIRNSVLSRAGYELTIASRDLRERYKDRA
jgi:hypothetical protein